MLFNTSILIVIVHDLQRICSQSLHDCRVIGLRNQLLFCVEAIFLRYYGTNYVTVFSEFPIFDGKMTMKRPFHFHQIGFTRNPFGALAPEEWAAIAVLPPAVAAVLADERSHMQLIGPMGCGKTTILQKLADHVRWSEKQVRYEYLAEGETQFYSVVQELDLFVLDEAQRLNWGERTRWLQAVKDGRLRTFFSSHKSLAGWFRRYRLPLQTIAVHECITLPYYKAILDRRMAFFTIQNQSSATLSEDAVEWLHGNFGQDLREAEYFLYEVWQSLTDHEAVTAVTLAKKYEGYGRQ
jgi:hypothetical protein